LCRGYSSIGELRFIAEETREGVVTRHNRLTKWDLTSTHGSTFEQTSPFHLLSSWSRWMRYCQDLLSRDRKAGVYQLVDEKNLLPMSVGHMKKPDVHSYP